MPRRVYFRPNPISSISRPLTHNELDVLRDFEHHSKGCFTCYQFQDSPQLISCCSEGSAVAERVIACLGFRNRRIELMRGPPDQSIVVEIPPHFTASRSLLRLNSLRHPSSPLRESVDTKRIKRPQKAHILNNLQGSDIPLPAFRLQQGGYVIEERVYIRGGRK